MSMSGGGYEIVRPGEGVLVTQAMVAPIRDEIRRGTYVFGEAQERVRDALGEPAILKDDAEAVLNMDDNKTYKAAFTSLVMEQVWPAYGELATGGGMALYELEFDDNDAVLERRPVASTADPPLDELADQIAASNQAMATFYVCDLFRGGRVPVICGNPQKDAAYFAAFRDQTELQVTRTKHFFPVIPPTMDAPSRFVASGMQSIRTHGFGTPNLIDGVTEREGIELTPDQHRTGVRLTHVKGITPYFFPVGAVMMAIQSRIADPETQRLLPERWMSNGDPDQLFVFPKPEIVRSGNAAVAQREGFPVQTGCPIVHSRVPSVETRRRPDALVTIPQSMGQILLRQLDTLYYPQRQRAYR